MEQNEEVRKDHCCWCENCEEDAPHETKLCQRHSLYDDIREEIGESYFTDTMVNSLDVVWHTGRRIGIEQGKSDRDKELVAFFKKDLKELSVEDKLKALSPNGIFQSIADDWKHDNEIKQQVAKEILDLLDYRILIITNELRYENITSNFAIEMSHRLSESRNLKCLLEKKYLNPTQFECKGRGSNNTPDIDEKVI